MPDGKNDSLVNGDGKDASNLSRRGVIMAGTGLVAGAAIPSLIGAQDAHAQSAARAKTVIIASHPYPDRSVVNKALWSVAEQAIDASYKNLESTYGDNLRGFDRAAERNLYAGMDRLVLMFPIHWFNLTPMMKAYLNEVWGAGAPPELRSKELLVVTTAGADADAYSREGRLGFSIEEVLTPLRASARYTGMTFSPPLAFLGVLGANAATIRGYQDALAARLREPPRRD